MATLFTSDKMLKAVSFLIKQVKLDIFFLYISMKIMKNQICLLPNNGREINLSEEFYGHLKDKFSSSLYPEVVCNIFMQYSS